MQNIFNYQTNFAYPLFVQIKNGKYIRYQEVTFQDYSKISNLFK